MCSLKFSFCRGSKVFVKVRSVYIHTSICIRFWFSQCAQHLKFMVSVVGLLYKTEFLCNYSFYINARAVYQVAPSRTQCDRLSYANLTAH